MKKSAQLEQMVGAYGVEVEELRRLKEEAEGRRNSVERDLREANQQMTLLKGEVTNLTRTLQATEAKVEKIEWVRAEAALLVDQAERVSGQEREENLLLMKKVRGGDCSVLDAFLGAFWVPNRRGAVRDMGECVI